MHIGIITLPLSSNYGGILQAYALQTFLENMGHMVEVINKPSYFELPSFKTVVKRYISKYLLRKRVDVNSEKTFNARIKDSTKVHIKIQKNVSSYIAQYVHIKNISFYSEIQKSDYDAFVVGSDQCWRLLYATPITGYFLDFAKKWNIKRIAYAASFGVDNWEYSEEQTKTCAKLASKFNAISVREDSAVQLCKEHLGVDAIHVLDPTMLLHKEDYLQLLNGTEIKKEGLFCYILDKTEEKDKLIKLVSNASGLKDYYCMPELKDTDENIQNYPEKCIFPPVEQWISSFRDADMVLVDSFHGAVFSIIFNKPFWVIGNKKRGMTRFYSLLSMFHLENRMIDMADTIGKDWNEQIDWKRVNLKLNEMRDLSLSFLKNSL